MSGLVEALPGVLGGVVSGILLYAGTRYTARSSREATRDQSQVESRKVSISEFETFTKAYTSRVEELERCFGEQEAKLTAVEDLLRLALQHIRDLRTDMRTHNVPPTRRTPRELESLLWVIESEPGNTEPHHPAASGE